MNETSHAQVSVQISPAKAGARTSPAQTSPAEAGPAEIGAGTGLAETGPAGIDVRGADLAGIGARTSPAETSPAGIGVRGADLAGIGARRTGPAEIGARSARQAEGGSAQIRTQTSSADVSAERAQIRVFLVDDHEIVRRGLADLLAAEPDIEVVGDAGTVATALSRMSVLRPDVAVLDVRLPDGDGVSACREIRSTLPETACLMVTGYGDDQALLGSIMAGAAGYVMKQASGLELVGAVRTVAAGQSMLDPHAAKRVMERLRERVTSVDPVAALSGQEKRVLDLIGEGLTNRQIAQQMYLSEKTVKNYVSALLTKLGMQRRAQAAALAARLTGSDDG